MSKKVNASRLNILKKGFPREQCQKCYGDADDCGVCDGKGWFVQKVDKDWEPPELKKGQWLTAFLDTDEWVSVGVTDKLQNFEECEFPFDVTGFATSNHMETLGFKVEW